MTVVAVSAEDDGCAPGLAAALAALPPGAPVVILIHGFRYAPGVAGHDPHRLILSPAPDRTGGRIVSWPRHLGLAGTGGLALAFGWQARGDIWRAYRRAGMAGAALARLIGALRLLAPDRAVHVVAHSLGARVALAALPLCGPGDVGRMILMAGAAFRPEASAAMDSPAGRTAEVWHVRGAENTLFEALLWLAFPRHGRTLGAGLPGCPGWVDLALESLQTRAGLRRLGLAVAPRRRLVCHWSCYARPGVFAVYRAILAGRLTVADLRPQPKPTGAGAMRLAGFIRVFKPLSTRG